LCGCSNPSTPAGHEGYVKENQREIAEKDAEIRIEEAPPKPR
jgi:hypothetical protein